MTSGDKYAPTMATSPSTGRTGRRPGSSGSRDAILRSARGLFATRGYTGTSVRAIAAGARVDPALVMHFFANKEGVFVAAMDLPYRPSEVIPPLMTTEPREEAPERLVRFFVETWDATANQSPLIALIRSAVDNEPAAELLRGFLERELLAIISDEIDVPDAELRASLVGAQMVGLAMARYVVGIEPLASADPETVVRLVAPTLRTLLTPLT